MVDRRGANAHSVFSLALAGRVEASSSSSKIRPWKASKLQLIARSKPIVRLNERSFMDQFYLAFHFPREMKNAQTRGAPLAGAGGGVLCARRCTALRFAIMSWNRSM